MPGSARTRFLGIRSNTSVSWHVLRGRGYASLQLRIYSHPSDAFSAMLWANKEGVMPKKEPNTKDKKPRAPRNNKRLPRPEKDHPHDATVDREATPKIEAYKRHKPDVFFTLERKHQILELMRSHPTLGGRKHLCAEAVGISTSTLDYHCKMDPPFAEAWRDAHQCWVDETLYTAAFDRSVNGVKKPIMGGKERDIVVATVTEYSDSLTLAMLKATRPEFKDKGLPGADGDGLVAGGVMIVPASPANADEWQDLLGEAAQGHEGHPTNGR